jgi:hypothetical protein
MRKGAPCPVPFGAGAKSTKAIILPRSWSMNSILSSTYIWASILCASRSPLLRNLNQQFSNGTPRRDINLRLRDPLRSEWVFLVNRKLLIRTLTSGIRKAHLEMTILDPVQDFFGVRSEIFGGTDECPQGWPGDLKTFGREPQY